MKKQRVLLVALTMLIVSTLCGGCRYYGPERPQDSGFLGDSHDYEQMVQIPGFLRKSAYGWQLPGSDWSKYDSVMLLPVKLRLTDCPDEKWVNAGDIEELKRAFSNAFGEQISKSFNMVNWRGSSVLVIDPCLTSVNPNKVGRNVALSILSLPTVFSGGVSVEMAFYDGGSGQRVGTFMDTKSGESSGLFNIMTDKYTKWGNVESAFAKWAKEISGWLSKAHKYNRNIKVIKPAG